MDPAESLLKRAAASIVEELNGVEHISLVRKVGFASAVSASNTISRFSHCLRMASYGNLIHDLKELSNELFFDAPVGLRAKLVANITALLASDETPNPCLTVTHTKRTYLLYNRTSAHRRVVDSCRHHHHPEEIQSVVGVPP